MAEDPITVHAPRDPLAIQNRDVQKRRRPYEARCGEWVKLPPTVRVRACPSMDTAGMDELYLEARPHPRYHRWCRGCHEATPGGLRDEP